MVLILTTGTGVGTNKSVDIVIYVDGVATNPVWKQTITTTSSGTPWQLLSSVALAAGTHTVSVRATGGGNGSADLKGAAMTVTVLP